jgi:hypothetical protein
MTEAHPYDAAHLALYQAKILAGLLSERVLNAGYHPTRDEHDRHAVLVIKVVDAIEACDAAMMKLGKLKAAA